MRAGFLFRIRILTGAIVLISALILLRLYVVQVVNGDRYAALADTQYTRPANSIYDRGTVILRIRKGVGLRRLPLNLGICLQSHQQK